MKVQAAITTENPDRFFDIAEIEIDPIGDDEILVETKAMGVNPTDWKGTAFSGPGKWGGTDASGVVVEVGKNVRGYKKGDYIASFDLATQNKRTGKYGSYYIGRPISSFNVSHLIKSTAPLSVGEHTSTGIDTFEAAAALPCALITLAQTFNHVLKVDLNKQANKDKYLLIWGGATATGIVAIQYAKLIYGLNVIVTASSNTSFLKSLGADHVINYKDSDAVEQIRAIADGKLAYALDTVSSVETFQSTYDATVGSQTIAIDNLLFKGPKDIKADESRNIRYGTTLAYIGVGYSAYGFTPSAELTRDYEDFWYNVIPPYLKDIKTANLLVLEPGLESANTGLQLNKDEKVHGAKIVFRAV